MCVVTRCRALRLSTTVSSVGTTKEPEMTQYTNPALEAELAYRRERLATAVRPRRRRRWFPRRLRNAR
jgi:hypothetical protein